MRFFLVPSVGFDFVVVLSSHVVVVAVIVCVAAFGRSLIGDQIPNLVPVEVEQRCVVVQE